MVVMAIGVISCPVAMLWLELLFRNPLYARLYEHQVRVVPKSMESHLAEFPCHPRKFGHQPLDNCW